MKLAREKDHIMVGPVGLAWPIGHLEPTTSADDRLRVSSRSGNSSSRAGPQTRTWLLLEPLTRQTLSSYLSRKGDRPFWLDYGPTSAKNARRTVINLHLTPGSVKTST